MPKGKFVNEGTIALRGVVRDGKLVGIIDHEEKERGIALVDIDKVTGGNRLSVPITTDDLGTLPLIETIEWIGNGTSQIITPSFVPDAIIVMGDGKNPAWAHRYTWAKRPALMALAAPHITAGGTVFEDDGTITIGSSSSFNSTGVTYKALVLADNGSGKLVCGSYSGNGVAGREIDNVGGEPVFVLVKRDNSYTSQMRFEGGSTGLQGAAVAVADNITGFTANGFTVSSALDVNHAVTSAGTGGEGYDYLALLPCHLWRCFSYVGSGTAGQKVSLPWVASAAFIKSTYSAVPQHIGMLIDGSVKNSDVGTFVSDAITSIASNGLTLGTNFFTNAAGRVYNGIAFANSDAVRKNAETKAVPAGLLVNDVASSGVVCATVNTGFDVVGSAFSLELYIDIDQDLATDQYLFCRSLNSSNITYGLYFNASLDTFEFVGHEAAANKAILLAAVSKPGPLHLVLTFDGVSEFRFGIDGKPVKIFDTAFTLDSVASSLMSFGCRTTSGVASTTGCAAGAKMYLARMYKSALTDAQILRRYKRCALNDGSVSDVSAYEEWDFSRVVGSTVLASKSATNNGTITACTEI